MNYDLPFNESLELFQQFITNQNKIITSDDLLYEMLYIHMTSWNHIDTTRCILWRGVGFDKKRFDAQLNIEISPYLSSKTHQRIYTHEKGKRLDEGWVLDDGCFIF